MRKYVINGIEFTQDKISLKNLRALVTILSEIEYPKDITVFKLLSTLGNRLPEIFTLILKSEEPIKGTPDFFDASVDDEQVLQIIEDFLVLRPTYKKLLNLLLPLR